MVIHGNFRDDYPTVEALCLCASVLPTTVTKDPQLQTKDSSDGHLLRRNKNRTRNMLVVGLTGGIASGKSTVSQLLKDDHKIAIVDADLIARQIVEPGRIAYKSIVSHFQPNIPDLLLDDGSLNRPALGKYIFANEEERKVLNKLTHPWVRFEMAKQVLWAYFTFQKLVVLDVPLLFESQLDRLCGSTICVICEEAEQLRRLLSRNPTMSEDEACQRIASQMSTKEKVQKADIVIDNSGPIEQLKDQVNATVAKLTPNVLVWLLTLVPPLAALSALHTLAIRQIGDTLASKRAKQE